MGRRAVTALALASLALGQQYDYGFDVGRVLRRQASSSQEPHVVRPLEGFNGTLPLRLELRELQKRPEQYTLYQLAASMMQYTAQSDQLSWYQISGIHGVPWQPWNGVEAVPGNENTGYCEHLSVLFPTWHRAYMLLYEHILYDHVQSIASLYTDTNERLRYQAAARTFRVPYLDWAARPPANESVLPADVGDSLTVNVSGPNGVQEIANPLYTYQFKPLNGSIFITQPYNQWPKTVRSPTTNDSSTESNSSRVAMTLDQNFPSFQQRVYNLFSKYDNYSTFSNEGWIPTKDHQWNATYDSLESIHDTIHTLTGLNGHMTWIPFSAFDPLFWLHHAQTDRLFAMWQVLNPTSWIEPTPKSMDTFTMKQGEIQDSKTPLTPFYARDDNTFWNSDMLRAPEPLGYTYPELAGFRSATLTKNSAAQAQVRAAVNRLYGTSSPASLRLWGGRLRPAQRRPRSPPPPPPGRIGRGAWDAATQPRPPPGSVLVDNAYRAWLANVAALKQGLDGSFFIHLFLGEPPAQARAWSFAPNLVGTVSVFASPAAAGGGGKPVMGGGAAYTTGTLPLTSALVRLVADGRLAGLEEGVVRPFLRRELRCRVVRAVDGGAVEPGLVPGLVVRVVSSVVRAPGRVEELPVWGAEEEGFVVDLI